MTRGLRDFTGRETRQQEQYHHHYQNHNHVLIGFQSVFQHQHLEVVDLLGIHARHLFFQAFPSEKTRYLPNKMPAAAPIG